MLKYEIKCAAYYLHITELVYFLFGILLQGFESQRVPDLRHSVTHPSHQYTGSTPGAWLPAGNLGRK